MPESVGADRFLSVPLFDALFDVLLDELFEVLFDILFNELFEALGEYAFEEIFLENLSFTEQINLFANSHTIVSPHGAGLANLVFSRPSTNVIEIFPLGSKNVHSTTTFGNFRNSGFSTNGLMLVSKANKI